MFFFGMSEVDTWQHVDKEVRWASQLEGSACSRRSVAEGLAHLSSSRKGVGRYLKPNVLEENCRV